MAYKNTKVTKIKTKTGTSTYSSPSTSGGASSSGGSDESTSGAGGSDSLTGNTPREVELLRNINTTDDPARHFWVVPVAPTYSDVVADTAVFAPYRTYTGTLGGYYKGDGINPHTSNPEAPITNLSSSADGGALLNQTCQGFTEVLGVVPECIIKESYGGADVFIEGQDIFTYVKSIHYDYRAYGHKVITIRYAENSTSDFEEHLHHIKLKVLFSDGSTETVTQPIISKRVTDAIQVEDYIGPSADSTLFGNLRPNAGRPWHFGSLNESLETGRRMGLSFNLLGDDDAFCFNATNASVNGIFNSRDGYNATEANKPKGDKHWWALGGTKGSETLQEDQQRYGAIFHMVSTCRSSIPQQAAGDDFNAVDQYLNGDFSWYDRYGLDTNSHGKLTGQQGYFRHPSTSEINAFGNPYLVTDASFTTGLVPPGLAAKPGIGATSLESYSGTNGTNTPYNIFHPVHQYYNAQSRNAFRHEGVAFAVQNRTTSSSQGGFLEQVPSGNTSLQNWAIFLRAWLLGQNSTGDPLYDGLGPLDPAEALNRTLIQNRRNGNGQLPAAGTKYFLDPYWNVQGGEINTTQTAPWGAIRDIVANTLIPGEQLEHGFRNPTHQNLSVVRGPEALMATVFGRKKDSSIPGNTSYPTMTDTVLATGILRNDQTTPPQNNIGVTFRSGSGNPSNQAAFGLTVDDTTGFIDVANSEFNDPILRIIFDSYVSICGLPFYLHMDFPVARNVDYAEFDNPDNTPITKVQAVLEMGSTETLSGGRDVVLSTRAAATGLNTLMAYPNVVSQAYPPLGWNVGSFGKILLDKNSVYYVDNTHFPHSLGKVSAPYNPSTLQPWGMINGDRDVGTAATGTEEIFAKYAYFYGGLQYNMGGVNNKRHVEIFLDNSRTPTTDNIPEVVFTHTRDVSQSNIFGVQTAHIFTDGLSGAALNGSGTNGKLINDEIDTNRIQFQTAINSSTGLATDAATWNSTDPSDIYSELRYTPGRYLSNPEAFLINEADRTEDSSEAPSSPANGDGFQTGYDPNAITTSLEYTGSLSDLDRAYADVDIEDIAGSWNYYSESTGNLENSVSTIQLRMDNLDHIGGFSDAFPNLQESYGGAIENNVKYTEKYEFVVPGNFDTDEGIVVIEPEDDPGCTDGSAINFDPEADIDDGTCILCPEDTDPAQNGADNYFERLSVALSQETIGSAPENTPGGGEYGLPAGPAMSSYLGGEWTSGNIGNVINYFPSQNGIAFPNNQLAATPWSYMRATFNVNPAFLGTITTLDGSTITTWYAENVSPNDFSLLVYPIEEWTGFGEWGNENVATQQDIVATQNFTSLEEVLISGDNAVPTVVLANTGTATSLKFGHADETTVGTVDYGIQPGQHYLALLQFTPKGCSTPIFVQYNFWVLYCDCDNPVAENYGGGNFQYPWSGFSSFPGVYNANDEVERVCQNNPVNNSRGFKRVKNSRNDVQGLCIIPDPYVNCNVLIDWCISTTEFNCNLVGEIGSNPIAVGTGSIAITVFGVFTGSDIDEYNLIVNGQWLFFTLFLKDSSGAIIDQISMASADDYAFYNITPANSDDIQLYFEDLDQGFYTVELAQISPLFPFQDPELGLCGPIDPTQGETGTFALGDGTECPEFTQGCTDPTATNFNPEASTSFEGVTIDQSELCEYEDCNDVFSTVTPSGVTVVPSTGDCATDESGDTAINFIADLQTGSATISVNNPDEVNYNVGVAHLLSGNVSVALDMLLDYYNTNAQSITDINEEGPFISGVGDGTTAIAWLGATNAASVAIPSGTFSATGLPAGNYIVVIVPVNTSVGADESFNPLQDCANDIFEFIRNFQTFQILLDTSAITDCFEPCNDTIPGLCDDYVTGCTDPDANNFNELANYDDGTCEYGEVTSEDCNNTPDSLECEQCEDLSTGPASAGLRICDEFFGTDEGCCDPTACNYNPLANPCMQSRCEYECCDPTEECGEVDDTDDDCEDQFGNIVPDCESPECPDPDNPNCDPVVINPCPTPADCPPPPNPPCVQTGDCPDTTGDPTADPEVIIDEVITNEVACDPLFGGLDFDSWRIQAMMCNADEGSKMYFRLRSGVKYEDTELIKLTLVNYLFNKGIDLPCLYSCDLENRTALNKNRAVDCVAQWKKSVQHTWAKTSTYKKGEIVRLIKNVRGKTRANYFYAKVDVPAGAPRPDQRINDNSFWSMCTTVKAQQPVPGTENYLQVFYEYMVRMCKSCNINTLESSAFGRSKGKSTIQIPTSGKDSPLPKISLDLEAGRQDAGNRSGLIDDNGNEIIF